MGLEMNFIFKLSEDFFHHFTVYVREAVVAPLMAEGQALVIDPELVQDGGL